MPPSVAWALVETSTGNHRPCGFSSRVEVRRARGRARPRPCVASASTSSTLAQVLARVDDQRRAGRLAALAGAGAARQQRRAELAGDVDRGGDVVARRAARSTPTGIDLVDRGVGGVAAARGGVEQHLAACLARPAARPGRAASSRRPAHAVAGRRRPRCGPRRRARVRSRAPPGRRRSGAAGRSWSSTASRLCSRWVTSRRRRRAAVARREQLDHPLVLLHRARPLAFVEVGAKAQRLQRGR